MKPLPLEALERILVVRSDHIGDLVLSTPFLRRLRAGAPQARITALVPPAAAEVLSSSSLVDRVVAKEPAAGGFDLALALAPRTASYKTVHRTGARYRAGYVYRNRPLVWLGSLAWLTHRAVLRVDPHGEVAHEIEQLDTFADLLGLPMRPAELEFTPAPEESLAAVNLLKGKKEPVIVLHMGVRWFTGSWQVEHLALLADRLGESSSVVVTAGPAEGDLAKHLKELRPELAIHDDLDLGTWAALLGRAQLLVSCDTGAVHLAAAQGTPAVVAYEPLTYNLCTQQWAPWRVPFRAVAKGEPHTCLARLGSAGKELLDASRMRAG